LAKCHCFARNKGVFRQTRKGVKRLLSYLQSIHVIPVAEVLSSPHPFAEISERFGTWMREHRGAVPSTISRYQRELRPFWTDLGDDPVAYDVARIRAFVVRQLGARSRGDVQAAVTALRAFFRFLVAEGRVAPSLVHCVPTVPQWRLSALPRYLEAPDVDRLIASCDVSKSQGLRDRAILLLLARLGLRAADIVHMTAGDLDWHRGSLLVRGKDRRETVLPLPQEVGDALLAYLNQGRSSIATDRIFLTSYAPIRPFATSATISDIVRVALHRSGIKDPPTRGAHLLRHSAATAMLRAGSSPDTIAMVLRHQSSDMTAYYAKVDVEMLRQVAQPWPVGTSC
jgi:site-specific recombinase XerD